MFKQPANDWQRGFDLTFDNGWNISVKWGPGVQGSNTNVTLQEAIYRDTSFSKTAEIAAMNGDDWWDFKNEMVIPDQGNDVKGFLSPDEVADYIIIIKNLYLNEIGRWTNGIHLGAFNRTKPPEPTLTDGFANIDLRHEVAAKHSEKKRWPK